MAKSHYVERPDFVHEYNSTPCGEVIYGTKQQLQALGIGINAQFPLNEKRKLRVIDPRGFKTLIEYNPYLGSEMYCASILFPGREYYRESKLTYAPGVRLVHYVYMDEYSGTDDALISAGLIERSYLPGQPGMGKTQVTLRPDGSLKNTNGHEKHSARTSGLKRIKRVSKVTFTIEVFISSEESDKRREDHDKQLDEWREKMWSLPRPAQLMPMPAETLIEAWMGQASRDEKFQSFLTSLGLKDQ
jgi:hypothetical protein